MLQLNYYKPLMFFWPLSSHENVMQIDGVEEDVPDELENTCSDDGKLLFI